MASPAECTSTLTTKATYVPMALTMNGRCYTVPEAVNIKTTGGRRAVTILINQFSRSSNGRAAVIKFCSLLDIRGDGNSEADLEVAMNITVLAKDVLIWNSYLLDTGSSLPQPFKAPADYRTTKKRPMRLIHFRIKGCHLAQKPIPKLIDLEVERGMYAISAEITRCKEANKMMDFTCVVDESFIDGGIFDSLAAAQQVNLDPVCAKCRTSVYGEEKCTMPQCVSCMLVGHKVEACPTLQCSRCDTQGHTIDVCPLSVGDKCQGAYDRSNMCLNVSCGKGEVATEHVAPMCEERALPHVQQGESHLLTADLVESGRSLHTLCIFDGKFIWSSDAIDSGSLFSNERVKNKIFLNLTNSGCFSVIIRLNGPQPPFNTTIDSNNGFIEHIYFKFFANDIATYRSYPVKMSRKMRKRFQIPKTLVGFQQPKRLIEFEATACKIHRVRKPGLRNTSPVNNVSEVLRGVVDSQAQGTMMTFACLVDEYITDGAHIGSIEAAIERDATVDTCPKFGNNGHGETECKVPYCEVCKTWCHPGESFHTNQQQQKEHGIHLRETRNENKPHMHGETIGFVNKPHKLVEEKAEMIGGWWW